jgi:two-component system cell cycle sensor histidine kinase PleC
MKGELFGSHTIGFYKDYSNDIHASGQHLLMLINEILDLSRIEAGRFDLKEEAVSRAHIVKECRRLRAKKRHIAIEKAVEHDLSQILADTRYSPSRLEPSVESDRIYPGRRIDQD